MDNLEILKGLILRVNGLQFGSDGELDDIKRKAKMVLQNLMPTKLYWTEVDNIKLEYYYAGTVAPPVRMHDWKKGQRELLNLLDTTLQDYQLNQHKYLPSKERVVQVQDDTKINEIKQEFASYKKSVRKWSIFIFLFIVLSLCVWIIYFYANWTWYVNHEKKIPITLMVNLTLLAVLLNIPFRSKWLIWISVIFGILSTLFTLI